MPRISIITAFLNEEANLPLFRQRVLQVLRQLDVDYEIVLVDDHSTDGSAAIARQWRREDPHVHYVRLSRNCGSHAAFSAGLSKCAGDCAILLAADLQDPPEVIPALMAEWQAGFEVVWAARSAREGESWTTRLSSRLYYAMMRRLALPELPAGGADFLLMDRKAIDAYNDIPEKHTSFLAMILWMGFRQTFIGYTKQARNAGRSKWTFAKKFKLWVDSLVSFTYTPIRLMSLAGIAVSCLGLLYAAFVIGHAIAGRVVEGWSSLMVVVLVLGGAQLLMLGVLGEYLWRTYDESRGRPRYIVEEDLPADSQQWTSRAA